MKSFIFISDIPMSVTAIGSATPLKLVFGYASKDSSSY